MKIITNVPGALCASSLALALTAAAQQPQFTPVVPATPSTTARVGLTADATSPVIVKVDGSRVIDAGGTPLGRIENIVLSPVGCAEAAILTGTSGRLIPVPWSLVRVSGDTRVVGAQPGANLVFTINTDQARLVQAPSFTRSQWPDMSNNAWLQGSTTFFGQATGATGGVTNTVTGAGLGVTATGGTNQSQLGTIATGATNQSRFGTTATTVPTNSTSVLPPTGRQTPGRPDFDQPNTPPPNPAVPPGPPENRPPENRPPDNRPPGTLPPPRSSPSTQP